MGCMEGILSTALKIMLEMAAFLIPCISGYLFKHDYRHSHSYETAFTSLCCFEYLKTSFFTSKLQCLTR